MRGCLFVLLAGVIVLVGAFWFAGPPLAGVVVGTTLTAAGLDADQVDVAVEADPPLRLAIGQADRVRIDARNVDWNGIRAARLVAEFGGVDLLGRTAKTAEGRLDDVVLERSGEDEPIVVQVAFGGPADAATTVVGVDPATAERLAIAAFEAETGTRPARAMLIAPDTVTFEAAGQSVSGRLEIAADGSLRAATLLGTVVIVESDELPFELTDLSVGPTGLELTGTLDVAAMLG
jgi:hypothetical protein